MTKQDKAVVAEEPQDYGELSGAGWEGTTASDFAIPFLSVLQDMSPQTKSQKPEYIDGAVSGMLLNTVTGELYDGTKGVIIVPCHTEQVFVEWKPRDQGGGFVDKHEIDSEVVNEAKGRCDFGKFTTPNGNELVQTFYIYGMILNAVDDLEPKEHIVVAITSTKIKKYRAAMSGMRTVKGGPPLFAFRLKMSTVLETNQKGDFYNLNIEPAVGTKYDACLIPAATGMPLLTGGNELRTQVRSGVARAAHESLDAPVAASTDVGDGKTPF